MWLEQLAASTRAYEPSKRSRAHGYLSDRAVESWNAQPRVRRWARLRLALVYLSGACSLGVALTAFATGLSSLRAIYAICVISFLTEAAAHGSTVWFTRRERALPFWPLFDWAWLRRASAAAFERRSLNDALVLGLVGALVGSLFLPLDRLDFHILVGCASACLWLLCALDGTRLSYVLQWALVLPAFVGSSPLPVVRLALAGTYLWSGASKLFTRSFYRDVAPEFFSPALRLLAAAGVGEAGALAVVRAGAGLAVLLETATGALLVWVALSGAGFDDTQLLRWALTFNLLMHAYIVLVVRLRGLWNWNLACLALAQASCVPSSLAGSEPLAWSNGYHLFALFQFLIFPITGLLGHGSWGRVFSFQFYVHAFEGESWLIVPRGGHRFARERSRFAFVGPDPIWISASSETVAEACASYREGWELARTEQGFEHYADLLERLANDEPRGSAVPLDTIVSQLGLTRAADESARATLLRETVALGANWLELEHCLERPFLQDEFSSTWECPRPWFWRFFLRDALEAERGVWVHKAQWTYRGYRSRVLCCERAATGERR